MPPTFFLHHHSAKRHARRAATAGGARRKLHGWDVEVNGTLVCRTFVAPSVRFCSDISCATTHHMATADQPTSIVGMPGSPYSRKLRAVLRYRRIPHAWVHQFSPEARGLPRPRVERLPQLILPGPDGTLAAHTDSTPLMRRLEAMFAGR